jgi:hypothetical protein
MAIYRDIPKLRSYLSRHIGALNPEQHKIAIICAHHPIVRDPFTGKFYPATEPLQKGSFGHFTEVTANLGATLMWEARLKGFPADIALILDNHSLAGDPEWFIFLNRLAGEYAKKSGAPVPAQKVFSKEEREQAAERYAKEHQGSELAKLLTGMVKVHHTYSLPDCLTRHLVSETDMVTSDQSGKPWFFESDYRLAFGSQYPDEKVGCAGEVNLIFRELAEKGYNLVIAFFPLRCQGPVCHAASETNIWLKQSGGKKQVKLIVTLGTEAHESDPLSELRQAAKFGAANKLANIEWLQQRLGDRAPVSMATRGWAQLVQVLPIFSRDMYADIAQATLGQLTERKSGKDGIQLHRE